MKMLYCNCCSQMVHFITISHNCGFQVFGIRITTSLMVLVFMDSIFRNKFTSLIQIRCGIALKFHNTDKQREAIKIICH